MWEIPWAEVQRWLIDAPSYESKKKGDGKSGKAKVSHDDLTDMLKNYHGSLPR